MVECHVVPGDVTEVKVDAIAKLIPPPETKEDRQDEVDLAIWKIAGDYYQTQVLVKLESGAKDGEVIVATGGGLSHDGQFRDVIYVNDLYKKRLKDLVYAALVAAQARGYKSLAFPVLRKSELWRLEETLGKIADEIHTGVRRFSADFDSMMEITVAAGYDPVALQLLNRFNNH